MHGNRIFGFASTRVPAAPGGRVLKLERPFWYEVDVAGLAPGDTLNGNVVTQANRPFLWVASRWMAYPGANANTNNTQPIPDVLATLYLQNEPLMSVPVALSAIAGPPMGEPQPLVEPFWIDGSTTIKAVLENAEASTGDTYTIRLILIGFQAKEGG